MGRNAGSMLRIITFNANGIRSAARKGFFAWLEQQHADVVCVQETRAREAQLSDSCFRPAGYHCYYYEAATPWLQRHRSVQPPSASGADARPRLGTDGQRGTLSAR